LVTVKPRDRYALPGSGPQQRETTRAVKVEKLKDIHTALYKNEVTANSSTGCKTIRWLLLFHLRHNFFRFVLYDGNRRFI